MKKTIIFLLVAICSLQVFAQQTDQFKDEQWIAQHKIKSLKEWFFIPEEGTMTPSEYVFITNYVEYNNAGKIVVEDEYKEGEYLYTSKYTYNKMGDKLEVKRLAENDSFLSKDYYVYEYTSQNQIEKLIKNDSVIVKFKYDGKQSTKPVEAIVYNKRGTVIGKDVFHYNDKGLVGKTQKYMGTDKLFYTKEFTYNDSSRVTEEITYNPKKTVFIKKVYKYNAAGHLNIELKYDADGKVLSRMIYTLDGQGKPVQGMYYNKEGKLTGILRYEYKYHQ